MTRDEHKELKDEQFQDLIDKIIKFNLKQKVYPNLTYEDLKEILDEDPEEVPRDT